MCLHVEPKTAVLVDVLQAGGCEIALTGSPATTDDGTAAELASRDGVTVWAKKSDDVGCAPDAPGARRCRSSPTCCSTTAPS